MKNLRLVFLAVGLILLAYLVLKLGPRQILRLCLSIGWDLLTITLIYGAYQLVRAAALAQCVTQGKTESLWKMLEVRLAGESVQYLTFTGPFLAEPAKAWLLKARGLSVEGAFAATITEFLIYTFASAAFSAAALGFLLGYFPLSAFSAAAARVVLCFMLLFLAVAAVAIWRRMYLIGTILQGISRLPGMRKILRLDFERVHRMEDLLLVILRERPGRFLQILLLESMAQVLLVLELYWILRAMKLDFPAAFPFLIEGAGKFISMAFFFVPTQVGAAEGTYVFIFQALGLLSAAGIALSLIRRLRSLLAAAIGLATLLFSELGAKTRR